MADNYTTWDPADYIESEEDAKLYLEAAADEDPGDGSLIRDALNDIARAPNMHALARDVELDRASLNSGPSDDSNLSLATVMKITRALGLKLDIKPVE